MAELFFGDVGVDLRGGDGAVPGYRIDSILKVHGIAPTTRQEFLSRPQCRLPTKLRHPL